MAEFVEKYINPEDGLSLKYYRGLKKFFRYCERRRKNRSCPKYACYGNVCGDDYSNNWSFRGGD